MVEGVDYSWGRPNLHELYRLGKRFIIRYVSWDRSGKNLTKTEADAAIAAGLSIVSNWEHNAQDQLGGRLRGIEHATEADRLHKAAGGPSGRPIYFSTDFDASTGQLATCYSYLEGAASVLGWARVGVYGSRRTIDYMASRGVRWLWQTYAWSGFSPLSDRFDENNSRWHSKANIHQYNNGVRLAGGDTDLCRSMTTDFGQWGQEDDMATAEELWDHNIPRATDIEEYSDAPEWRAQSIIRSTQTWAYRATKEARKAQVQNAAILAAIAGQDVVAAVVAEVTKAATAERAERAAERAALLTTLPAAVAALVPTASAEAVEAALRTVLGGVDEPK